MSGNSRPAGLGRGGSHSSSEGVVQILQWSRTGERGGGAVGGGFTGMQSCNRAVRSFSTCRSRPGVRPGIEHLYAVTTVSATEASLRPYLDIEVSVGLASQLHCLQMADFET